MTQGYYVAIEGIDGSGKTSLMKGLKDHFGPKGSLTTLRLPGGSVFAEKLRESCRNENIDEMSQVMFYSTLIRDAKLKTVKPALANGDLVISDRSFASTLAYQALPSNNQGLLLSILEKGTDMPVPDLVIYLNVDMDEAIAREMGQDRGATATDRYSTFARQHKEKIKEGYDLLYGIDRTTDHYELGMAIITPMWKLRSLLSKSVVCVDANDHPSDVLKNVIAVIESRSQSAS